MTEIARRNADNTALVQRHLAPREQRQIVKEITGRDVLGVIANWSDADLDQVELVRVAAVEAPPAGYGERVVEDVEKVEGAWRQAWTVERDGTLEDVKDQGIAEVRGIIQEKIDALLENQGTAKVVLHLLLFNDLALFRVDGSASAAVHPMLDAYRQVSGVAAGQVPTAVDNLRLTWMNRARTLLVGEATAIAAVTAATTLQQIETAVAGARAL